MHKDLKKYVKELELKGWVATRKRKAIHLKHPSGKIVSCSITPSCPHFLVHVKSDVAKLEKQIGAK